MPFDGSMQLVCLGRKDRQVGLGACESRDSVNYILHHIRPQQHHQHPTTRSKPLFHVLDPSMKLWKKYRREKHNVLRTGNFSEMIRGKCVETSTVIHASQAIQPFQVKVRGHRVELLEIEAVMKHEAANKWHLSIPI